MKLSGYKHLFDIDAGFDQVTRGLATLRKHDAFPARELDHFSALVKEARAATNSYLIGVMDHAETDVIAAAAVYLGFRTRKLLGGLWGN